MDEQMIGPSIFDLLEPLSAALVERGGPDIRGGFARGTGGVDLPYMVETLGGMAGKVAELIELLTLARKFVDNGGHFEDAGLKLLQQRVDAALAPYPERR